MLATALLAACTPLGGSPGGSPSTSARSTAPVVGPTSAQPTSLAAFSNCLVTTPVTSEHPRNGNTASFSRTWYVSPDRLLWASADGRFYAGATGNKVLWERPGSALSLTGKLLSGDAKAAGVPKIGAPQGYESVDYQASGVTFPVAGCWEVEARAGSSVLAFVTRVYPSEYGPAGRSCIDLSGTFRNSDAVLQASVLTVAEDLLEFAAVRMAPTILYKAAADLPGSLDLHIDLAEIAPPRSGDGYVLFMARDGNGSWKIVCPFRTLATIDTTGVVRLTALRFGSSILPADARELDQALRELAK
jgi:hypothetical protein